MSSMTQANIPRTAIRSISIKGMFGKYDFNHIPLWGMDPDAKNVAFLYGDNGVGKTTILKLIYSILSDEVNEGHRSYIARTKFQKIEIVFGDGQKVSVVKESKDFMGSFRYIFEGPNFNSSTKVIADQECLVRGSKNPKLAEVESILSQFPNMIFVNDQRHIKYSSRGRRRPPRDSEQLESWGSKSFFRYPLDREQSSEIDEDHVSISLAEAIRETYDFMVSQSVVSSSAGDRSANQVYLDVARAIARAPVGGHGDSAVSRIELMESLRILSDQIAAYEKYRVFGNLDVAGISQELEQTRPEALPQLISVIAPYVRSLSERVAANQQLLDIMVTFETTVNRFLRRKCVEVNLIDGIRFIASDGEDIKPSALSSGEKHLMFLSCSALTSRDAPTVILIDEPELSLNYKWQRELTEGLLALAGPMAQFIMATHSFEILSGATSAVVPLDPEPI